jgi:putative molybdopterin biosynthesis protein
LRTLYLEDIPLEEARARFWGALEGLLQPLPAEEVDVADALGRVTAEPLFARTSVPHYHASAMDGIAVRAEETLGASETAPLRLRLGEQATWVDTGDPLPPDTNAVIMAEQVQDVGPEGQELEILASVAPWQHVRPMGEDIVATELVLPENHQLSAVDLGALVAAGYTTVPVRRRPGIAILPTGSELVEPGHPLKPGDIVDFNSVVLAGQVREWGGEATRLPITPDDRALLLQRVRASLATQDAVVINAGSSAGAEDYTSSVVEEVGQRLVHGVAIRPGHPLILGVSTEGKPVLGIPGYPVSTILTSELFLRPLIYRLQGLPLPERSKVKATITRKLLSPMGEEEYVRVKLGQVGERLMAAPLSRGAGVIMSMVRADGLMRIARFSEGVHAGAEVEVELLRRPDEIRHTVVAIGSHDLALDLLSNELARRVPGASLASANVGSLGGLLALARDEAHLAGSHLLDEQTGEYNVSYIKKHLPETPLVLLNLAGRVQGLILPPGNPKRLCALEDLARSDVLFVNRQRGSGTRVLLDYKLRQAGIDPRQIRGYAREEFTHLAVAAAVASGAADVGLGILAAARALSLEFVPLFDEQYQLVIPRTHYEAPLLAPLLEVVRGGSLKAQVEALGGYDVSQMGTVAWES